MKHLLFVLALALLFFSFPFSSAMALQKSTIKATVIDVDGKPVPGAYLFLYDSPNTRRAVDLVSPETDKNGYCEKDVPAGKYWALARLKSNAKFDMGPLMVDDKFSGDPIIIEIKPGEQLTFQFTVMDLLDNIKIKSKKRKDLNKISGKVVNDQGEPLANVFAYANKNQSPLSVPDFFSAWTETDGVFTIYLPVGNYNINAAPSFTRNRRYKAVQDITVDKDISNLEIVLIDEPEAKGKR